MGLFARLGGAFNREASMETLENDPDILQEAAVLSAPSTRLATPSIATLQPRPLPTPATYRFIPLYIEDATYQPSEDTAQLLREVGGGDAIRRMTELFYQKAFRNPALDKFLANREDPHGQRLGNWIVEKMSGEGPVWTEERRKRAKCPVARMLSNGNPHIVKDRTTAHTAAWWSPKRPSHEAGERFQIHDCRVWMRLMFWSALETGMFTLSPSFEDWYVRFIAHFVRVYERGAPPFARESARWSLDPINIATYEANGCKMGPEVLGPHGQGIPHAEAYAQLPAAEARDARWPYDL